jgi:chromo domain-containing protein 1
MILSLTQTKTPNPGQTRKASDSSPDVPLVAQRRRKSQPRGPNSDSDEPDEPDELLAKRRPTDQLARKTPTTSAKRDSPATTRRGSAASNSTAELPPRDILGIRRGKGALRGGSSLQTKNVFERRGPEKKKRPGLIETSRDPSKEKKLFTNMHIKNKALKASRELADAAPDITALPGGLFDPSNPSEYQPLNPTSLRKTSSGIPQESDSDALFVSEREPLFPQQNVEQLPSNVPAAEFWENTLGLEKATCYFWLNNGGRCANRSNCTFLHRVIPGVPASSRPSNMTEDFILERETCYYWHLNDGCTRGESCRYLHYHEAGIPIAPPWVHTSGQETASKSDHPWNTPSATVAPQESSEETPQFRPTWQDHPQGPEDKDPSKNPSKLQMRCWFWRNYGICSKGDYCGYQHTTDATIPVAENPNPRRYRNPTDPPADEDMPLAPPIDSWDSYRPDTSSRQHDDEHPPHDQEIESTRAPEISDPTSITQRGPRLPQKSISFADDASRPTKPRWNPYDPFHAICFFWHEVGKCSNSQCRYIHISDASFPVAPDPRRPELMTCRYWVRGTCYENPCKYLHEFVEDDTMNGKKADKDTNHNAIEKESSATYVPTGPRLKSVKFAIDEPMDLFEEPDSILPGGNSPPHQDQHTADTPNKKVCRNWKIGKCHFGNRCWFRHSYKPGEDPSVLETATGANSQPVALKSNVSTSEVTLSNEQLHQSPFDEHVPSAPEGQITPTAHVNISNPKATLLNKQPQQSPIDENVPSVLEAQPTTTAKTKKSTISEYRRKQAVKALGTKAKKVTFGDNKQSSITLNMGDLGEDALQPCAQEFSSLSVIQFDQACIVQDFELYHSYLQRQALWVGSLVPVDPGDSEASKAVDNIVEELRLRSSGLIAVLPSFIILTFPARLEEWKFLEKSSNYPKEVRLRYLVFQSHQDIKPSLGNVAENGVDPRAAPYRKALMKNDHEFSVARLLPTLDKEKEKGKNPYVFYLLFPSTANSTADFVFSLLQISNTHAKTFSSQTEGSWEFFAKNFEVGVVLVHESAASDLCSLPMLPEIIQKKVMFWYISDSSSPYPMFPSDYSLDNSKLGKLIATRLFPHGAAILLTPSFIVAEPEKTYSLLQWFFGLLGDDGNIARPGKLDSATSGTWKIVCCYNFIDYLLEVANAKSLERDQFYEANKDKLSKDAEATQKGLGFEKCSLRYEVYNFMLSLQRNKRLGPSTDDTDYYYGIPDEKESPLVFADRHSDPDNEKALIEWYAGWSMGRLDRFRRFYVVGTSLGNALKASRLKEFPLGKANDWKRPNTPASTKFTAYYFSNPNSSSSPNAQTSPQKQKALSVAAKFKAPKFKALEKNTATSQSAKSPRTPIGAGTYTQDSPAMSGSDMSVDISSSSTTADMNRNKEQGIPSMDNAGDYNRMDIDSEIMKLIAEESKPKANFGELIGNPGPKNNARELPRLTTSHLNTHSFPNSAATAVVSAEPNLFSPDDAGTSAFQFDGAGDDRPISSGTDSSRTSRSGIQIDENGQRMVPCSIRSSGTVRKEIPIKPSYTPIEDKEFYRNRRVIDGVPQHEVGSNPTSAVASPSAPLSALAQTMGEKMNLDVDEAMEEGEVKEETEWKEIKFEATTAWYKRLVAQGGGWGHISVDGWEKQWKVLGIVKK